MYLCIVHPCTFVVYIKEFHIKSNNFPMSFPYQRKKQAILYRFTALILDWKAQVYNWRMSKTVRKTNFAPNPKGLLNFYVRVNLSNCESLTVALNWSGSQRDGGNNMPQPLPKSLYVSSWYEAKCQTWKWFKRLMMHVTSYRDSHTHTQTQI